MLDQQKEAEKEGEELQRSVQKNQYVAWRHKFRCSSLAEADWLQCLRIVKHRKGNRQARSSSRNEISSSNICLFCVFLLLFFVCFSG